MTDTITPDEYRALLAKEKPAKYRNTRVEEDGHTFDSKAERKHYQELKLRVLAGEIEGLVLQPRFPLVVNGVDIGTYVSDFLFWDVERQERVVQDVKGVRTPVYRLKKKLMKALHNIDIEEVFP